MPITLQIAKTTTTSPAPLLPGKFKALDPKSWMMETEQVKPKVVCWRFSLYTFCFKSKVAKIDVHFFWQGKPWQPPSIFRIWNNTEQQLHPSSRRPQGRWGASHQAGARAHGGNRAEAGGGTTGARESGPVALVFKCNMNFSLRWCLRVLEETERTILIPKVAVWKSGNFIRSIFWPKCWICLGFANVVLLDFESGFDKTSTFGDLWFRTDYSWHFPSTPLSKRILNIGCAGLAKSVDDFPSGARCNTRIRWCMSPWPSTSTSPWFRRCRSRLRCLKSNIKMRSWRFPFRSLALGRCMMGTYMVGYEWIWWTIYCSQQDDIWVEHETFLPCAANPSRVKLSNNAELPFWEKW